LHLNLETGDPCWFWELNLFTPVIIVAHNFPKAVFDDLAHLLSADPVQ
jgi:hypothetical protein